MNPTFKSGLICLGLSFLALPSSGSFSQNEIEALKDRVEKLETTLSNLDQYLMTNYGLIKHCTLPHVANGEESCDKKLSPESECKVVCNSGYIATPGNDKAVCQEGGVWSNELQCEIPLLVISGGTMNQKESEGGEVSGVSSECSGWNEWSDCPG